MRNNNFIISTLIALFCYYQMSAQMNFWATPPSKLDVRNTIVSASPLYSGAPGSDSYQVSNGMYSGCGNLLFFIKNNQVFNAAGVNVGQLGGQYTSTSFCQENYMQIKGEVALVPKPGSTTDYYAIYIMADGVGIGKLFYAIITVNGSTVTVTNQSYAGNYPCGSGGSNIVAYNAFGLASQGANPGGIAVSKVQSNGSRYLYVCGDYGIAKYDITSAGITGYQTIVTPALLGLTNNDFGTMELELSSDSKWLAFSNYNAVVPGVTYKVFVVGLDPSNGGQWNTQFQSYTLNAIKGLEFDNATPNPNLFVAGGTTTANVLAKINLNTQAVTNISTGGYDWSNTFLEYGKNGRIMGIVPYSGSRRLMQINPINNTVSASILLPFNSQHTYPVMGNVYTLPDQIDFDDYTYSIAPPPVQLSAITLNSSAFTGNCDEGGLLQLYNCNAILLNAAYVNNVSTPSQYKITLTQMNGCTALNGSSYLNYVGNWTSGAVPANLDIRYLTDANGNSLLNKTGRFQISVSVMDNCNNISTKSGMIDVYATVTPTLDLEIYNTYWTNPSNTYLSASQNIASPILTGALTAGFRINNSIGNVTGYNVTIDQVDNTGIFIKNIYNMTYVTNNISSVSPQQLNSFCVNSTVWNPYTGVSACTSTNPSYSGYTGYWGYSNGQLSVGNYYKITVTLYNPCSNSTNYSYIYVNNGGMRIMNSELAENTVDQISIYPNPANSRININIASEQEENYSVQIYDLTGRLITTVFENIHVNKDNNVFEYNTEHLNTGTYLCKIISDKGKIKTTLIQIQK